MKQVYLLSLSLLGFVIASLGQSDVSTFKAEVRSAFVWGEDTPSGAISSVIHDPLTDSDIPALRHDGVQVSSRMGFEKLAAGQDGDFLGYTATIVNDTAAKVSIRYGGISVDGRAVSPLSIIVRNQKQRAKKLTPAIEAVKLEDLHCVSSGFLLSENFFSSPAAADQFFFVDPKTALTVTSVIRDPRNSAIRCSLEGCHPAGTIRYSIRVRGQDYIFVWPGQSISYCGK